MIISTDAIPHWCLQLLSCSRYFIRICTYAVDIM